MANDSAFGSQLPRETSQASLQQAMMQERIASLISGLQSEQQLRQRRAPAPSSDMYVTGK